MTLPGIARVDHSCESEDGAGFNRDKIWYDFEYDYLGDGED